MYFQTKKCKERLIIKFKKYFFGLFIKFYHTESNFNDFKYLPKNNNKKHPIKIKIKKIISGIPIKFQHK